MVKPRKFGKAASWQVIIVFFVLALLSFLIFISSPAYAKNQVLQQVTPTPVGETLTTNTPLPEEWVQNSRQTDGIALGGTILVLIIIVGTLGVLLKKPGRTTSKKFKRNKPAAK